MKCICKDWYSNINKINGYIGFCSLRFGFNAKGYDGKFFKYCPWCGTKLIKEKNEH